MVNTLSEITPSEAGRPGFELGLVWQITINPLYANTHYPIKVRSPAISVLAFHPLYSRLHCICKGKTGPEKGLAVFQLGPGPAQVVIQ